MLVVFVKTNFYYYYKCLYLADNNIVDTNFIIYIIKVVFIMKAICIDDEQLALDYLERQINKIDDIEVIGKYLNPVEGKAEIIAQDVDLVFLDIQLPGINGIELAEQILKEKPDMMIIFVTAYDRFAVEAFELHAMDYLVKPVKLERLQIAIDRVKKQLSAESVLKNHKETLRIKVSNYLKFEDKDNQFKTIPWRTAKTQELFIYLLLNHGKLVEKSTLMELLWEVKEVNKAYSLLYTTVYNVRKALKPFGEHFILHNNSDGYLLELNNVEIDLMEWEKKLMNLDSLNLMTIDKYEAVMELNTEPYLNHYDYYWLEAERHRLEKLWFATANTIAKFYETNNETSKAILTYKQMCERYPENEEIHFSLMKIYEKEGKYKSVIAQYRKLITIMRGELATEPSNYINKWYEKHIDEKVKNMNFPS